MKDFSNNLVVSLAGSDKGRVYAVLATEGKFAYVADGRKHKIEKPKKKNLKHIKIICGYDTHSAGNKALRKATGSVMYAEKQLSSDTANE